MGAQASQFTWVVFIDGANKGEVKAATHEEAKALATQKFSPPSKASLVVYAVVDVR
jgi:hypothetical protein